MCIILDTCTINNLIQVDLVPTEASDYELEYDYLAKINSSLNIKIPQKIKDELKCTFERNLINGNQKKVVKAYIDKHIHTYVHKVNTKDFQSSLDFVKKHHPKYIAINKQNGELYSTALALYLNRYEKEKIVFGSYFVTDDAEAIDDFRDFFKINFLGEIFTTIDILLLLSINGLISHENVINFAKNLKKQYIKNFTKLIYEIDILKKSKISATDSSFLTALRESISKLEIVKIQSYMQKPYYVKNIKKKYKYIDEMIHCIITEDFNKVEIIENKIKELQSKYWTEDEI